MKKKFLLHALFLLVTAPTFANDEISSAEMRSICFDNECDDLCNSLALKDLCAKKIRAKQGLFKELCAQRIKSESICTRNLGVENVAIANVCASDINATTLCVTGTARINEVCGLYRASAQFAADTPYVLGTPVNYDVVIDDPNGNVSVAPFSYTVPVSGYYMATIEVHTQNITGANPILGVPVARVDVKVNGIIRRPAFSPLLTFGNHHDANLASLLILKAGDVVTVDYHLLILDSATGSTTYAGSAEIVGGPGHSIFTIHYLSSTCTPSASCESCSLIPVPCNTECIPLPNTCIHRP